MMRLGFFLKFLGKRENLVRIGVAKGVIERKIVMLGSVNSSDYYYYKFYNLQLTTINYVNVWH